MTSKQLKRLLKNVTKGLITAEAAQKKIEKASTNDKIKAQRAVSSGCRY